jgi:hypothetical protein
MKGIVRFQVNILDIHKSILLQSLSMQVSEI